MSGIALSSAQIIVPRFLPHATIQFHNNGVDPSGIFFNTSVLGVFNVTGTTMVGGPTIELNGYITTWAAGPVPGFGPGLLFEILGHLTPDGGALMGLNNDNVWESLSNFRQQGLLAIGAGTGTLRYDVRLKNSTLVLASQTYGIEVLVP